MSTRSHSAPGLNSEPQGREVRQGSWGETSSKDSVFPPGDPGQGLFLPTSGCMWEPNLLSEHNGGEFSWLKLNGLWDLPGRFWEGGKERGRERSVWEEVGTMCGLPFITPCKLPQLIYSVWYHIDTKAQSPNCFIVCSWFLVRLEARCGPCWHQASVQAALGAWRPREGSAWPTSCLRVALEPHGCSKVFAE